MASHTSTTERYGVFDATADYVDRVQAYVDAGFDHVYLHQTGPNQEAFVDFAGRELLPEFA